MKSRLVAVEKIALRLVQKKHTNTKGDGVCPWCHVSGGNGKCDFEKLRIALSSGG